jgi:hypothetical protein
MSTSPFAIVGSCDHAAELTALRLEIDTLKKEHKGQVAHLEAQTQQKEQTIRLLKGQLQQMGADYAGKAEEVEALKSLRTKDANKLLFAQSNYKHIVNVTMRTWRRKYQWLVLELLITLYVRNYRYRVFMEKMNTQVHMLIC